MSISNEVLIQQLRAKGWAAQSINALSALIQGGVDPAIAPVLPSVTQPPLAVAPATSSSVLILSAGSLHNLQGVHPKLVDCVKLAIGFTLQDFCVYEGLRTIQQQHINVQRGVSQTMDSMHIPQFDGLGHAVDLVPWINGKPTWDWTGCYKIAAAMDKAANQLGIAHNIRWGGAWDRRLSDFNSDPAAFAQATHDYAARHPGKDFLDGPHFEWRD